MVKMTDVTTEKNATDDTQWSIMPAIELALPSLDHDQVDGQMPEFQRSRLNSEKFQSKSQTSKAIFCALCVQIASFSFGPAHSFTILFKITPIFLFTKIR